MTERTFAEVSSELQANRDELRALLANLVPQPMAANLPVEFPRSRLFRSVLWGPTGLALAAAGVVFVLNPTLGKYIVRRVPLKSLASRLIFARR